MASSVSGQDESNPALQLATWAGKMELSCPLGTTCRVPQEKLPRKPYHKSFIDQACSFKMAGYWPHSFFASLWTSTLSRSINSQKMNLANIQPSWPHTWSITHIHCFPASESWSKYETISCAQAEWKYSTLSNFLLRSENRKFLYFNLLKFHEFCKLQKFATSLHLFELTILVVVGMGEQKCSMAILILYVLFRLFCFPPQCLLMCWRWPQTSCVIQLES